MTRFLRLLATLVCLVATAFAGTITGVIQTPTGGAIANGTLTFVLSQPGVLSGTASVVTSPANCYTDPLGNVVGIPDPLATPVVSTNTATGTLSAGTYYVKIAYWVGSTISNPSPEFTVNLPLQGELLINAPLIQPTSASGFKVYVGSSSGTETLQGTVTGWTQYAQSIPLVAGAALPGSNNSVCSIAFSDQLIPTGTYYTVSLTNRNGATIAGFPQSWCTFGGGAGTINISNGAPVGNCNTNGVFYPTPIFANSQNNSLQSINTQLTINGQAVFTAGLISTAGFSANTGSFSGNALFNGALTEVTGAFELTSGFLGNTGEWIGGVKFDSQISVGGGLNLTSSDNIVQFVGPLTTTASASDAITVTSPAKPTHCTAQATNSTAAGLTGVYVNVNSSTGVITLFHSASANGNFDMFCGFN